MKHFPIAAFLAATFTAFATTLLTQANTPASIRSQLASTEPQERVNALKQLDALGTAAAGEAPAVERAIKDPDFNVRLAAVRTLPKIVGPAKAAQTFDAIVRDTSAVKGRPIALTGLETCGSAGLATTAWAIKNGDEPMQHAALVTASIIDTESTLFSEILPLIQHKSEAVTIFARRYVLADGIRKYYLSYGRWPTDFVEIEAFVRKSNPLITLGPLTPRGQIRFEPEPDGVLAVRAYSPQPDGTLKGAHYYKIQKPQKK